MAVRKISEGKCPFKGRGKATLTILGYQNWKRLLKCNDHVLNEDEIEALQSVANYSNYGAEGVIKVEWPTVAVEFDMNKFLGGGYKAGGKARPMILSTSNNFARIMHPFAVDKEWFRGFDNKDTKKIDGFNWLFTQKKDLSGYEGSIEKGGEVFVTFEFCADPEYHFTSS